MGGWRALGLFWALVLLVTGGTIATLAVLGPPAPAHRADATPSAGVPGGPVAAPDPALLAAAPDFPGSWLPQISRDGREPRLVYAAASSSIPGPRVALLVAGMGLNDADSLAAVGALPWPVDFALSAETPDPAPLEAAIRAAGHEYLLSLPMEPAGYPGNDEGAHQLLTGAAVDVNDRNLEWALSRLTGYVGVTGASDGQRGERFAGFASLFDRVVASLGQRGLLYLGTVAGAVAPRGVTAASVTVVIDDPPDAASIDAKLTALAQAARLNGAAIGLVGRPDAAVLPRLAAFTRGLAAQGVTLVPVSALVTMAAR